MSISGGFIALMLILLRPVTCRVFSARWHCAVGAAALAFFIVPFYALKLPALPAPPAPVSTGTVSSAGISGGPARPAALPAAFAAAKTARAISSAAESRVPGGLSLADLVLLVYISGVAAAAAIRAARYRRFIAEVNRNSAPVESEKVLAAFSRCCGELGLRRVALVCCPGAAGPFAVGVVRPTVVVGGSVADGSPDDGELELVFRHELLHISHGDLALKLLFLAVSSVHWFNPLCYALGGYLNRCGELACDEAVVEGLGREERKRYGRVLLAAEGAGRSEFSAALCGGKARMKHRLEHILSYKKPGRSLFAVSLCAALILGLTGCAAGRTVASSGAGARVSAPSTAGPAAVQTAGSSVEKSVSGSKSDKYDILNLEKRGDAEENAQVSGEIVNSIQKLERFMQSDFGSNKNEYFAISNATLNADGFVSGVGGVSADDIVYEIVKGVISDKNERTVNSPCAFNIYGDAADGRAAVVQRLTDVFSNRAAGFEYLLKTTSDNSGGNATYIVAIKSEDDKSIRITYTSPRAGASANTPIYVLYFDKSGGVQKIIADDANLNKAKSGINPITGLSVQ